MLHVTKYPLCDLMRVQLLGVYEFEGMSLQDVAVTSDGQRMFAVGTMVESPEGLRPTKSRKEKQIISRCWSYVMDHEQSHI